MTHELRYSTLVPDADRHTPYDETDVLVGVRRNEELFDAIIQVATDTIRSADFSLTISLIISLHSKLFPSQTSALRSVPIAIAGAHIAPPSERDVPDLMAALCEYTNRKLSAPRPLTVDDAIHVAAFTLWRLNWIHPFADGNGALARALAYMLLSIGLDTLIPGYPTIPEQLSEARSAYYQALESADAGWREGVIDTTDLEALISTMLQVQLLGHAEQPDDMPRLPGGQSPSA